MFPMSTHARGKIATANVFNLSWSEPGCENMVLTRFGGIWLIRPREVRAGSLIRAIAFLGRLHACGACSWSIHFGDYLYERPEENSLGPRDPELIDREE